MNRETRRHPPKREIPRRRYTLALTGDLAGFTVTMGAMRGRDLIALQRGELDEADVIELVADRALEHDLPVDDLRDLDGMDIVAILTAWSEAQREAALPPTSAEPLPQGSAVSP